MLDSERPTPHCLTTAGLTTAGLRTAGPRTGGLKAGLCWSPSKSAIALVAVVGLLGGACSGDDGSSGSTDPTASQEVSTGQSVDAEFVGDAEEPAEGDGAVDPASTNVITVRIELPPGEALQGTVIVALEDVGLADGAADVLSEVRVSADQVVDNLVDIDLPIPVVAAAAEINAAVHVDRDGDGTISTGDLLSTSIVPVPEAAAGEIVVPVDLV